MTRLALFESVVLIGLALCFGDRICAQEVNVAPLGTASQSSEGYDGAPGRAIDCNTDGWYVNGSVTHTSSPPSYPMDPAPWWQVDLGKDWTIVRIVLWNRTDCCWERLSNFRVTVLSEAGAETFAEDFFTDGFSYPPGPDFEILLPPDTPGKVVVIAILGPSVEGFTILSLAEVQVFSTDAPPPELPPCGVNPNGWIKTHGWNMLLPLLNPLGCTAGDEDSMLQNWVAPHVIGAEDPKAGDVWDDIDFGLTASSAGWGGSALFAGPTWVSNAYRQNLGYSTPDDNLVDFEALTRPIEVAAEDALALATTYVENITIDSLPVEICSSSDDSIQIWVNDQLITSASICRTTSPWCDEMSPAILPVGISKIAVLVWQGADAWGFRLGIVRPSDGHRYTDADSGGLVFLGTGEDDPGIASQSQYLLARRIEPSCPEGGFNVSLRGNGSGGLGASLTVTESVLAESAPDLGIGNVSHAGRVQDILAPPAPEVRPVGQFASHGVVGDPQDCGLVNNTVFEGGKTYRSMSATGGDVWADGDTFEFAYMRLEDDFDIAVRILGRDYSTDQGWHGKFGLMARKTLETDSRFSLIHDSFPLVEAVDSGAYIRRVVDGDASSVEQPVWTEWYPDPNLGGGYINIPASPNLKVESAPFSLEAWVHPTEDTVDQGILASSQVDGFGYFLTINRYGGHNIDLAKSGVIDQSVDYEFLPDTWYHIAAVQHFEGSSPCHVEYFVNGASVGSFHDTSEYIPSDGKDQRIAWAISGLSRFAGIIDEVAVYGRALDPAEILQHYEAGLVGEGYCAQGECPPGMISYWRFDEGSGTTVFDSVGGNHGAIVPAESPPVWTESQVDGALLFHGEVPDTGSGYIDVGRSPSLKVESAPFSLEAWVDLTEDAPDQMILSSSQYDCFGYFLTINRSGYSADGHNIDLAKAGVIDQSVDYEFLPDTWYHIAAVQHFEGGAPSYVEYFVNGASIGSFYDSSDYFPSDGSDQRIAWAYANMNRFGGIIDEVAVYGRALDPAEILQHYEAGLVGEGYCPQGECPPGLISYWKFDEGGGTTVSDSVGGNHGSIIPAGTPPVWWEGQVNGALLFSGGPPGTAGVFLEHPASMRLTSRGNLIQAWASNTAGSQGFDAGDDVNWALVFSDDWGPAAPRRLYVGFANCEMTSSGCTEHTIRFELLHSIGTPSPVLFDSILGKTMTWNVSREEADAGLGYGLRYPTLGKVTFRGDCGESVTQGARTLAGENDAVVPLDVYPGSCPNPVNVVAEGALSVAVLGTSSFDAAKIDPASVRLEGVAPAGWAIEDVAAPFLPLCAPKDDCSACSSARPDGQADMTFSFPIAGIAAVLGEVADGECRVVGLSGQLKQEFGGSPFLGEDVIVTTLSSVAFVRGDANADGAMDISDPVAVLNYLFGTKVLPCLDAGDVNADGSVNITDAIYSLRFLFLGEESPKSPYPECGIPPVIGELPCGSFLGCPGPRR